MSSLKYFTYSPFAEVLSAQSHYSQAVRVGDRIECSGQGTLTQPPPTPISSAPLTQPPGGWDATGAIPTSLAAEMEQAFANVDACLRSAGATGGWAQVYKVNLYTTDLSDALFSARAASMKKWAGEGHRPLLTGVGVSGLGLPGMRVEIEVVAHVPAGGEAS